VNPNEFNDMPGDEMGSMEEQTPENQAMMPLGAADFGDGAGVPGLDEGGGKKSINGGAIIIALVVAVSVGGLFLMRKFTQVTLASAQDAAIEAFVNQFIEQQEQAGAGETDTAEEKVMAGLSQDRTERQVDPDDLQRDPFVIVQNREMVDLSPEPLEVREDPAAVLARRQAQRRIDAVNASEELSLKSVMGGSRPLAIINGQIYRPGETIAAGPMELVFRIATISTSSVELVHEAPELGMSTVSGTAVTVTLTLD
jgi:hypothetical protein